MEEKKKRFHAKLIFLDVDGVLNCQTTTDKFDRFIGIDDAKVALLKQIVEKSKSKIILTTSWKEHWEPKNKENQDDAACYLDYKLAKQGLKAVLKTASGRVTPRGLGIKQFLNKLQQKDIIVDSYVILDDEYHDYYEEELIDHLIKTEMDNDGLKECHVEKALKILMNNGTIINK